MPDAFSPSSVSSFFVYSAYKPPRRAPIAGSGPEINSRACLCVLQGPRHNARCFFSIQHFIFLRIFCLETPKTSSYSRIRARDQFSSLSLCTTGTRPQCQMLFLHPAFHLSSYILPTNPQDEPL